MPGTSVDSGAPNGQDAPHSTSTAASKKTKQQQKTLKAVDANASKLLKHRIAQLEQDAAGEKDQEAEIGEWVIISVLLVFVLRIHLSIGLVGAHGTPKHYSTQFLIGSSSETASVLSALCEYRHGDIRPGLAPRLSFHGCRCNQDHG